MTNKLTEKNEQEVLTDVPLPNRDMFIQEQFLTLFPILKPILHNEEIERFFEQQESRANKWKQIFARWGRISLIIVCALLILLSWRLSLARLSIQLPHVINYLAAVFGLVAVTIQISLAASRAHSKWLYARFVAERVRLWKYQCFLDGELVSLLEGQVDDFNLEFANRWTLFTAQFKGGGGALSEFMESSPFDACAPSSDYRSQAIFSEVRKAYQIFRMDVQKAHLAYMNKVLETADSWTDAVARITLLISGVVVIIDACLVGAGFFGWNFETTGWGAILAAILGGSALSMAIVSAGIRVYRKGSAITEERERYRFKQLQLRRIDDQLQQTTDSNGAMALMNRAELVCTEELQEFLKAFTHADYFL